MENVSRSKWSKGLICAGLLLIAAALALTAYNLIDERRAERSAAQMLEALDETSAVGAPPAEEAPEQPGTVMEEPAEELPAYLTDPDMPMPTVDVDGNACIGKLEVPSLELSLPVISEWSYPKLKIAPCRYQGSAYRNDLIIAAHNYDSHFGRLHQLNAGDVVRFTDGEGNLFTYAVSQIEELPGTAIEEMEAGEWDLTLFTCTLGGRARVTVRCTADAGDGAPRS